MFNRRQFLRIAGAAVLPTTAENLDALPDLPPPQVCMPPMPDSLVRILKVLAAPIPFDYDNPLRWDAEYPQTLDARMDPDSVANKFLGNMVRQLVELTDDVGLKCAAIKQLNAQATQADFEGFRRYVSDESPIPQMYRMFFENCFQVGKSCLEGALSQAEPTEALHCVTTQLDLDRCFGRSVLMYLPSKPISDAAIVAFIKDAISGFTLEEYLGLRLHTEVLPDTLEEVSRLFHGHSAALNVPAGREDIVQGTRHRLYCAIDVMSKRLFTMGPEEEAEQANELRTAFKALEEANDQFRRTYGMDWSLVRDAFNEKQFFSFQLGRASPGSYLPGFDEAAGCPYTLDLHLSQDPRSIEEKFEKSLRSWLQQVADRSTEDIAQETYNAAAKQIILEVLTTDRENVVTALMSRFRLRSSTLTADPLAIDNHGHRQMLLIAHGYAFNFSKLNRFPALLSYILQPH